MKVNGVLLLLLLVVVFDSILFNVRVPLWMLCRLIFYYYFVFRTDERMTDNPCYSFYCWICIRKSSCYAFILGSNSSSSRRLVVRYPVQYSLVIRFYSIPICENKNMFDIAAADAAILLPFNYRWSIRKLWIYSSHYCIDWRLRSDKWLFNPIRFNYSFVLFLFYHAVYKKGNEIKSGQNRRTRRSKQRKKRW